jgi:hypothetical protein
VPTFVWVLAILLVLAVLLLQDLPWLGISQALGHNPQLISRVVVIALVAITVLMSVDRVLQTLS